MQVGIQIVKKVLFRGVQQEFQNVYHYILDTAVTAPDAALIDAIVAIERDFHSTDVTFVRGSIWSSGGSPGQNQMRFQKDLTGAGNQGPHTSLDRERSVLIRWPAGKDKRGRNVYLRKFFHSCGSFAGVGFTGSQLQNVSPFSSTDRGTMASSANRLKQIHAELWNLCAESGRRPSGDAQAHEYLEHHQLGDQWRA
jgi:hypothetical protein